METRPFRRRPPIARWRTLLGMALGACLAPALTAQVVFLAGARDAHPRGTHEYAKVCHYLAALLRAHDVESTVVSRGWPEDVATLDRARSIVLVSAGADQRATDHPFLAGPGRLDAIERQMARGCGLVVIHWGVFVPRADAGERFLRWIGGHFDYESGPPPRHWSSAIRTLHATVRPSSDHPIVRALPAFSLRDEFYHRIRFPADEPRWTPLLDVELPDEGPQTVAWALEREDGGRGVGFTGLHFQENVYHEDLRRFLVRSILWSAGREPVDRTGLPDVEPIRTLIVTGHDHPAHPWRERTDALRDALDGDPRTWIEELHDPDQSSRERLRDVDVVVWNYCNWERPGLGAPAQDALLHHLGERGMGLVLVHFANGAFHASLPGTPDSDWPAWRTYCLRVWDHGTSGHDPFGPIRCEVAALEHPIVRGLSSFETRDELYVAQRGDHPLQPLVTALSRTTGRREPLAWTHEAGPTRVFQTLLGHAPESIRNPGFAELLRRGTAWAARRPVRPRR